MERETPTRNQVSTYTYLLNISCLQVMSVSPPPPAMGLRGKQTQQLCLFIHQVLVPIQRLRQDLDPAREQQADVLA